MNKRLEIGTRVISIHGETSCVEDLGEKQTGPMGLHRQHLARPGTLFFPVL